MPAIVDEQWPKQLLTFSARRNIEKVTDIAGLVAGIRAGSRPTRNQVVELNRFIRHLRMLQSRLQKIAEEYNVAIFITNQMTADPGASMSFPCPLSVIQFANKLG